MGLPRTLAAIAGHRSGHSMASSWCAAVGYCVPALLKKPREFGLGSCDQAWRGHFSETFM